MSVLRSTRKVTNATLWICFAPAYRRGRKWSNARRLQVTWTCLLRVVVAHMAHYSRFIMDTLLKHPSVQDCKTSFVLDCVKTTTAVLI